MTGDPDCARFKDCSCALCPLADWLDSSVWSLPEPVCGRQFPNAPRWLSMQRRMARKLRAAGVKDIGLWSWRMLDRVTAVTPGLHGLGPDDGDPEEERWLAKHPAREPRPPRAPTEAQIAAREKFAAAMAERRRAGAERIATG